MSTEQQPQSSQPINQDQPGNAPDQPYQSQPGNAPDQPYQSLPGNAPEQAYQSLPVYPPPGYASAPPPPPPGYAQPGYAPPPPGYAPPGYAPPPPGYAPPGYAQPGYPPPQYYSAAPNAGVWGTSSLGNIGAHTAAGLAYLLTFIPTVGFFIPIIMFFVEKNRFAKFHAAQAAVIEVGAVILFIVFGVLGTILAILGGATTAATNSSAGGGAFGLLLGADFACIFPLIFIAYFVLLIWGAVVGFQGKYTKLPVVGDIAERFSGGPIAPGMPNLP